jgi:hypothetical protein
LYIYSHEKKVIEDLKSQQLRDVSIGFDASHPEGSYEAFGMEPIEISLCKKGAMDNTHIMHFDVDGELYYSKSAMDSLYAVENTISPQSTQQINTKMADITVQQLLERFGVKHIEELEYAVKTGQEAMQNEKTKAEEQLRLDQAAIEDYYKGQAGHMAPEEISKIGNALEHVSTQGEGVQVIHAMASCASNHKKLEDLYNKEREAKSKLEAENTEIKQRLAEQSQTALSTESERKRQRPDSLAGIREGFRFLAPKTVSVQNSDTTPAPVSFKFDTQKFRTAASTIKVEELPATN